MKQSNITIKENLPTISFFGIFDGHGGDNIAEELKLHLHEDIVYNQNFLYNPEESILRGFKKMEDGILERNSPMYHTKDTIDKSGACANVLITVNDIGYLANLGDSRAMTSINGGSAVFALSIDHKPNFTEEQTRIQNAGGFVYKSDFIAYDNSNNKEVIPGVYRVKPGKLAVSRTFGDVSAKIPEFEGKRDVILAVPDIISFKMTKEMDFILIGSDGIFDKLSNNTIAQIVFETLHAAVSDLMNFQNFLGQVTTNIIKAAIDRDSRDNISCIFICLENLYNMFMNKNEEEVERSIKTTMENKDDGNKLLHPKYLISKRFFNEENIFKKQSLYVHSHLKHTQTLDSRAGHALSPQPKREKKTIFCCGLFSSSKTKEKKYLDKTFDN
jgi:serine/threonine protein phosphatase PrpC